MDNRSTASTNSISASNRKIECPFCKDEFQARFLFGHIQKKHAREFADAIFIKTADELDQHIDNAWPVSLLWKVKNDFDEEEDTSVYGCLGCGTGLPSHGSGMTHCNKEKCKAKHIAGLKTLMPNIKRKQKETEARHFTNWTEDQTTKEITIAIRWYKYMWPYAERIVGIYNEYIKHYTSLGYKIITIEKQPLAFEKDNVRSELRRWWNITGDLGDKIDYMRNAMLISGASFGYNDERWEPFSAEHNPTGFYVKWCSMAHPAAVALYPDL